VLDLILHNLSNFTSVLSDATTDGAGSILSGAPLVLTVEVELDADVPDSDPVLVCVEQLSVIDGEGRRLGAYAQGGVVTSTMPVAPPPGTHIGCPEVTADFDGSGKANVGDVKCCLNCVLAVMAGPDQPWPSCASSDDPATIDADCSGTVDLVDFYVALIATLDAPFPTNLDANGDGCIDRCELP
jgi:hypothetical protein